MDINRYTGLVLGSFLSLFIIGCNSYYEDDYEMSDQQDQALVAMIDDFQTTGFLGSFGIREDSLVYGYCDNKVEFDQLVVDTLQMYNLTGGVVHRKDLTYFIQDGFFLGGNVGVLYTKKSLDNLPDFRYHRLLRKSKYGDGNWYFVENETL